MKSFDFKRKLLSAGLEKEDFSELTKISLSTIAGWTTKRKDKIKVCPAWVESYLDLYIKNRENEIYVKKLLNNLKMMDNKND